MNNNSNGANHITTQVPLNVMKYTISNGAKNFFFFQVTVLSDTPILVINSPSTEFEKY